MSEGKTRGGAAGKGPGWTLNGQRIDLGAFISAVYFLIVVPYPGA